MPIKTLKIKRVFAYTIYRSLKGTPPKEYPSTGEIKTTITDILPTLKVHVGEYIKMSAQADELAAKVLSKEITEEQSKPKMDAINLEWRNYSKEHGDELVKISLDGEAFKSFKEQFERDNWGKTWVINIDEFSELVDAFNDVKDEVEAKK